MGKIVMTRQEMERFCVGLGKALKDMMPEGVGFTLMTFDYGSGKSGGNMAYMSTGHRDDMVRLMEEMLEKLRGDLSIRDSTLRQK